MGQGGRQGGVGSGRDSDFREAVGGSRILAGRWLDVGLGSVTGGRREKIVDADVRVLSE